jgi:DtxR family Mn-dependent transcriptional regulator
MDAAAGPPTRCPQGEPIPDAVGHGALLNDLPLTDLAASDRAEVSRVRVRDADRLMYLADIGLVPQAPLRIEGRGPFRGPLRLTVGAGECVVAFELAETCVGGQGRDRIPRLRLCSAGGRRPMVGLTPRNRSARIPDNN